MRAAEDHPVLVSTSRHVSQGILEVKKEAWSDNTLSGVSEAVGGDAYELRIAGLRDGGKQWAPSAVSLSEEDRAAGVKASYAVEAGVLRVKITSPVAREVKWRVDFTTGPLQPEKAENLKAAAKGPYDPVALSWDSNAPFLTITRDGEVIATGCFGQTYLDNAAPRGKTHAYTVAVDGGAARSTASVAVPAYPAPPPLPDVQADGLKPVSSKNGWGEIKSGKSIDGGPLTVDGKTCTRGLGLHAPAEVVYARDPEWKRFVADIGLNESQRAFAATTVVCKVVAEDAAGKKVELAVSPLMSFGGVEHFPVDVQLPADCAKVYLVVDDGGDGNRCDHVNLGNAGFIK